MDVGFGKELREQRESRGVALEAIANGTKVSIQHLRALEADRGSDLPGGVFNKGIVRSYCRFVGLEEGEWLNRFAASEMGGTAEPDWATFAESVKRNRIGVQGPRERGWWGVILMVLGLTALAWVAWHFAVRPRLHWQRRPDTDDGHAQAMAIPARPPAAGSIRYLLPTDAQDSI